MLGVGKTSPTDLSTRNRLQGFQLRRGAQPAHAINYRIKKPKEKEAQILGNFQTTARIRKGGMWWKPGLHPLENTLEMLNQAKATQILLVNLGFFRPGHARIEQLRSKKYKLQLCDACPNFSPHSPSTLRAEHYCSARRPNPLRLTPYAASAVIMEKWSGLLYYGFRPEMFDFSARVLIV